MSECERKESVSFLTREKSHIQPDTLPLQQAGAIIMYCPTITDTDKRQRRIAVNTQFRVTAEEIESLNYN